MEVGAGFVGGWPEKGSKPGSFFPVHISDRPKSIFFFPNGSEGVATLDMAFCSSDFNSNTHSSLWVKTGQGMEAMG